MRPIPISQMSLFDERPEESLADYAFLYTATEKGNNSGIRFMMTTEDAQKWCSSEFSQGVLHGTSWSYFYTSVENYVKCHWGTKKPIIDLRKCTDNGSYDEKIFMVGAVKISFTESKNILERFGINVLI